MPLPELIGRYRPVRRLGSGGFAVVWLAHDESLDAEVAVKVMADNWADRMDLRERFLREARMLRQAASHRIVQVFDIGELEDGRPYLVMEHADRGTLAERVKEHGAYPLAEALRVTAEVARGVAELHAAGVVHRDLKPSNVLIKSVRGGGERLLVADLGVAKSLAHGSGVTMSVGSAGYMAPEQMEPQIGVDVRADVYSLGAFAFHLMTAQRPYLPLVMAEKMPPGLPAPVLETLLSALERDRENRWPDAASLAERFDELAAHVADDLTVAAPAPVGGGRAATPVSAPAPSPSTPVSPTPGWSYAGPQEQTPDRPVSAFQSPPSQPLAQPRPTFEPDGYQAAQQTPQSFQPGYGQGPGYGQTAGTGYGQGGEPGYGPGYGQQPPHYAQQQAAYPAAQQFAPSSSPPASSRPASSRSADTGRGRWMASMVAVVAVAAATGIGSVMFYQSQRDNGMITVASADKDIQLTSPSDFGPELVDDGWDPSAIGLKGEASSGLLLANDFKQWSDLTQDVNGVFVGLSTDKTLPDKVQTIEHEGCTKGDSTEYADSRWSGQIQTWSNCSGADRTVQEIHLKPVAADGDTYVYLQVRRYNDEHSAEQVIEGLTIKG